MEMPADQRAMIERVYQGREPRPMRLRQALGAVFLDEDYVDWYGVEGRPGVPPGLLCLVVVLQFLEDLTDREAADAVRGRLDWKYSLGVPLEYEGFDYSVLSEFRDRLEIEGRADRLLGRMLAVLAEQGLVRSGGRVRTDSTHVLASVRRLNRLELVGESLRAVLDELAASAPQWLVPLIGPDWEQRYGRRVESGRLPRGQAARDQWTARTAVDGQVLLDAADAESADGGWGFVAGLPQMTVLRRVWARQFVPGPDGRLRLAEAQLIGPSSGHDRSPWDPDIERGVKRSMDWEGYKLHVSEACDPDLPHVITSVVTTGAAVQDYDLLPEVHDRLAVAGLLPGEHYVDAGYISLDQIAAAAQLGVVVVGPVAEDDSWQAREHTGYDRAAFVVDWDASSATCPQGHRSRYWSQPDGPSGSTAVVFDRQVCRGCPVRELCTRAAARKITLPARPLHDLQQRQRREQLSAEWKARYGIRAGVEGCISRAVRAHGARRCRYRGLRRTHVQHILTACGINAAEIADWYERAGSPSPPRPISAFRHLALETYSSAS